MIGIFDSGMGGLSVLYEARKMLPKEDFIYYGDSLNAPYGIKKKEEIIELSIKICDYFMERNVDAIVVACNTATSVSIDILREKYDIPIIGMEPALKPAIKSNKGKAIAVLATELTLKEKKFKELSSKYKYKKIINIPAPKIVEIVEKGMLDEVDDIIKEYFKDYNKNNIESVVLGCTHFIFIKNAIKRYFRGKIDLVDGNKGTVNQLIKKLKENNIDTNKNASLEIINTKKEYEISNKLLDYLKNEEEELNKLKYIEKELNYLIEEKLLDEEMEKIIRLRYGINCERANFDQMCRICNLKPNQMKKKLLIAEKKVFNILKRR